jgi:hypothetical protein
VRLKAVPEPADNVATLAAAQRAVPRVPGTETDCCARIAERLGVGRDHARTWLTFLRALELVERTDSGFVRAERDPEAAATRKAFRERVFGARETLAAVADGPVTVEDAFQRVAEAVPAWERDRRGDWRAHWRERTARLLAWAVLLDLAAADGERFSPGPAYREP